MVRKVEHGFVTPRLDNPLINNELSGNVGAVFTSVGPAVPWAERPLHRTWGVLLAQADTPLPFYVGEAAESSQPSLSMLGLKHPEYQTFLSLRLQVDLDQFILTSDQFEQFLKINDFNRETVLEYAVMLARLYRGLKRGDFKVSDRSREDVGYVLSRKIVDLVDGWKEFLFQSGEKGADVTREEALTIVYLVHTLQSETSRMQDLQKILTDLVVRKKVTTVASDVYLQYQPVLGALYGPMTEEVFVAKKINKITDEQREALKYQMVESLKNPVFDASILGESVQLLPDERFVPPAAVDAMVRALSKISPETKNSEDPLRELIVGYGFFAAFRFSFPARWVEVLKFHEYPADENDIKIRQFREGRKKALNNVVEAWKTAHTDFGTMNSPRFAKSRVGETMPLANRLALAAEIAAMERKESDNRRDGGGDEVFSAEVVRKKRVYLVGAGVPADIKQYETIVREDQVDAALMPAFIGKGLSPSIIAVFDQWKRGVWIGKEVFDEAVQKMRSEAWVASFPLFAEEQERWLCEAIVDLEERRMEIKRSKEKTEMRRADMLPVPGVLRKAISGMIEEKVLGFDWETSVVALRFTPELLSYVRQHSIK